MKKVIIVASIFLSIIILTIILLKSVKIEKVPRRYSLNIEDSKKRETYLWSYKPKEVVLNDSLEFRIIECFAEKQFIEYRNKLKIREGDSIQIRLVFDRSLVSKDSYNADWIIKDADYRGNGILIKLTTSEIPDTLCFDAVKIEYKKPKQIKETIGRFFIQREGI